jgi:coenzyme Q-binding protein COQ10
VPTHAIKHSLSHSAEQMFDLVADIERYPEFLPWCLATRIKRREENVVVADMVVGFKMIRERFTTTDTFVRPHRVDVSYSDGPFKYLNNHWIFEPEGDKGCTIDFYIDFEFKSKLIQMTFGRFFNDVASKMLDAFIERADVLYGCDDA